MSRKADHSDLSDKEWQIIKPLILPPKPGGHPRTVDMRSCSQCHFLSAQNWLLMGNAHLLTSHPTPEFIITFDAGKDEDFGSK
jgi:transposase